MTRIFISYRREDSAGYAGRIYDRLVQHFGPDQIFMDVDNIRPGMDFVEAIEGAVGSCDVLVALVGKQWATITDDRGEKRLNNPNDFVRLEVKTALDRNILVIPTLVHGAGMPRQQDLPPELEKFTRRNAFEISNTRFHEDLTRLTNELDEVFGTTNTPQKQAKAGKRKEQIPSELTFRWQLALTVIGIFLIAWVFFEAWFEGLIRTELLVFLAPIPYVILGFEHLRHNRKMRGVIFLTYILLVISEISPFQPYRILPSVFRQFINVLTSITIPLSIFWSIIDLVKRRKR
jgi:hypothetical protein